MSATERLPDSVVSPELARVAGRRVIVFSPMIRFRLNPGDRALVTPGDSIVPGMPIAERTPDASVVDVGRLELAESPRVGRPGRPDKSQKGASDEGPTPIWRENGSDLAGSASNGRYSRTSADASFQLPPPIVAPARNERRHQPVPGKWWVGGDERRDRRDRGKPAARFGGTLLFETNGRWRAAAGERHETVESPVAGVVREARNGVQVTMQVTGAALPGAIAAGEPSRGYLDVPRLMDGDLWASALDVGRSGAVVVAGSRISAQSISRARAMSIRGLVAGSVGQGELRDLAASESRQKASLAPSVPFGLLALDGHQRRPIATPILALLAALAGREVAIITDPPLLVFDVAEVPLPELPPDWIRVRSGPHAGREGRWLESAGLYRFRGGIHLEGAVVRFVDETATTVVPVSDLERFIF
ncbi:MAG TPA: hypothetical protein VF371_03265 [Candidatus Limnocylindrales bacterium]